MRYLILFFLLILNIPAIAQIKSDKLIGNYQDHFGSSLEIKSDSTFRYTQHFDLSGSWSKGKWYRKKDTIFFKTIIVYDTLRYIGLNGQRVDSLIKSDDEIPKVIKNHPTNVLHSGGQNFYSGPEKLYYKNERLFGIDKQNRLIRKRFRGFWTKKKFPTWFFKEKLEK
jgi:hypothetical protein